MSDKLISGIFTRSSLLAHLIVSIAWFHLHGNLNLFTNLLSIEAIVLTILVGYSQKQHHEAVKEHITKETKQ